MFSVLFSLVLWYLFGALGSFVTRYNVQSNRVRTLFLDSLIWPYDAYLLVRKLIQKRNDDDDDDFSEYGGAL